MGQSLSVELSNLPTSAAFLVIGWSSSSVGSIPLPYSLTTHGMPGCFARVSTDHVEAILGAAGTITHVMPVPNSAVLNGVQFYQQGYSVDPAANAAGFVASNAVRIGIGSHY
jgi:hypothetical protein